MSGPDTLVTVRGLEIEAESDGRIVRMLRGVDLDIARGRIVGVVGESGSGKSTLASAIIGLLPANVTARRGTIDFDGSDLLALGPEAMRELRGRRIAMIFQDPMTVLNPVFTVGTQMTDFVRRRFPGDTRRAARARAEAMLTRLGIPDARARLATYPHQLSGGMRQRVMIAIALLTDAELILADEPTTALDATIEAQIVTLFKDLQRELSGSVLFISHHLGLLSEFCDDVAVMYGGLVVETGPMALVASKPNHPYTAALIGCEIDERPETGDEPLRTIPGQPPSAFDAPVGCLFAPRCAYAIEACRAAPPPMLEVGPGRFARCIRTHEIDLSHA